MQTQTHKTHHGPDLGEATTFPLIGYTLCLAMGPTPKCHFVSRLPNGSLEIPEIGLLATLRAHKVLCRPLIEMRYEAKL
jgi:hypothetical protein